jgi:CubicO group peptidase (beta-lactamase class C family)
VLHEGEVILKESFGLRDVENQIPAESDTAYFCGSVTKILTSAATGILVGDGLITWKDLISTHLPDFDPVENPELRTTATLADALRHTTGLANPNTAMMGPHGNLLLDRENHMDLINSLPTSNQFGQRFHRGCCYSNATFGLMSHVLEKVSEKSYSEFMTERILEPLGMCNTFFADMTVDEKTNLAHPYMLMENGKWVRIPDPTNFESCLAVSASMGMRSSVNDMLRFAAAVLNCHDQENDQVPAQSLLAGSTSGPLQRIARSWEWSIPIAKAAGFADETKYLLGWYATTIPTPLLGFTVYNNRARNDKDRPYLKKIIGAESSPRRVYGHNGIWHGSYASFNLLPESLCGRGDGQCCRRRRCTLIRRRDAASSFIRSQTAHRPAALGLHCTRSMLEGT